MYMYLVLVQKKNGNIHFCIEITNLNKFPLQRIDDNLDILSGFQYFSTLDHTFGYWQVAMEMDSTENTTFTTLADLFQFRKMPFGLVNAPTAFQ